jgi:hypothetical protein
MVPPNHEDLTITQTTKVELFKVLGILPIFVCLVSWLTVLYIKANAAEVANDKQDAKIEAQTMLLLDIRDRIIKIEEQAKHRR